MSTIKPQNNEVKIPPRLPPQFSYIISILDLGKDWIAVEKLMHFCFWVEVGFWQQAWPMLTSSGLLLPALDWRNL